MIARNEADTRAELIDKLLREAGWDSSNKDVYVRREHVFTDGRMAMDGTRGKLKKADYLLEYKNVKLAIIEAKSESHDVNEGVQQAKAYASALGIPYAYSTNGHKIYQIPIPKFIPHLSSKRKGKKLTQAPINKFPTPDELWSIAFAEPRQDVSDKFKLKEWKRKVSFHTEPYPPVRGYYPRYYQDVAIRNTMNAIARGKDRILLNLATGTGKTDIAFHICWKLYRSRWSLSNNVERLPRILFISDRNILTDQAIMRFNNFPQDELIRVSPKSISKRGGLPMNGSVFFSIFQTLMGHDINDTKYKAWDKNFFDLIIIDECHRGGARDESIWRALLEYFQSAVHIGLTATPKVAQGDNVNTYQYFGAPVYTYSLDKGIEDGFLASFKQLKIRSNIDDYTYLGEDEVEDGDVEEGDEFREEKFNVSIEIEEREEHRVKVLLENINQNDKTIIFCQTMHHAALVSNLVNQNTESEESDYCARVTSRDGEGGNDLLRRFQDNEKDIPAILTTSRKLSTGVDVPNLRNIVLMRNVKSMVEFKQIIGRGTRLCDDKNFFTIVDFSGATELFNDPDWDGPPIYIEEKNIDADLKKEIRKDKNLKPLNEPLPLQEKSMIKIKLADGKERSLHSTISRQIYFDGKTIKPKELVEKLNLNLISNFCNTEDQFHGIWSNRNSREKFLFDLDNNGYSNGLLKELNEIIVGGDQSDLYDLLKYVAFSAPGIPLSKKQRVEMQEEEILKDMENGERRDFAKHLLNSFIEEGSVIFDDIGEIIKNKYGALEDAWQALGDPKVVIGLVTRIQKKLFA